MEQLKSKIRHVPDFPKPGILFYDITTLLRDPVGFAMRSTAWHRRIKARDRPGRRDREPRVHPRSRSRRQDRRRLRAGPEAGQAAGGTCAATYDLEYGSDSLEMHRDAVQPGQRVLIVDDLLATGGTARATVDLVNSSGERSKAWRSSSNWSVSMAGRSWLARTSRAVLQVLNRT